ncbi:MAG TPA: alpha/beta fold hydrolase [Kofleriaceae bacterium]|nr:alpha/beta fold hydrolase [Kofleriaceae bacterium]
MLTNKRYLTCSLISLATALAAGCDDTPRGDGKTYVLVHGAFTSSASWQPVADGLRAEGARVLAPDLPAHGEDPAPASAATLDAYVARIEETVETADGHVVLVGHSLGGIVVSQLAERRPDAIDRAVYVGAYAPENAQSLLDLTMLDRDSQIGAHLQFHEDGTVDVEAAAFPDLFCADCDAAGRAALIAAYQAEPGTPFPTKLQLGAGFASVPKTYVHTASDRVVSPQLQGLMTTATAFDREVTVDTSHVPQLAAPDALVDLLLDE